MTVVVCLCPICTSLWWKKKIKSLFLQPHHFYLSPKHPPDTPSSCPSPSAQKSAAPCHCHSDLIWPEPKWHLIRLWISIATLLNWLGSSSCKIKQGTPMGWPEAMLPPSLDALKNFMLYFFYFLLLLFIFQCTNTALGKRRYVCMCSVRMSSSDRMFPVR